MHQSIGHVIRMCRQDRQQTQRTVSADTGIPTARLSRIESGQMQPTETEVTTLARYFSSFEILQSYWLNSQIHQATIHLCERMGMQSSSDLTITATQFGTDITNRIAHVMELCRDITKNDASRHERLTLAGQELMMISNLSNALRMLICDIKV